jgi:hypothetical protein
MLDEAVRQEALDRFEVVMEITTGFTMGMSMGWLSLAVVMGIGLTVLALATTVGRLSASLAGVSPRHGRRAAQGQQGGRSATRALATGAACSRGGMAAGTI